MVGTASTVKDFLLVECSGPWGVDAVQDCRLPDDVKHWMAGRRGGKTLLIRRGRSVRTQVFRARGGVLTGTVLSDVHDLTDLDLDRDLTPYDGRLLLVCTHGRHDACCAERGRPLWEELRRVAPEETWQVSHIGGDRFAGNVLVLPDGLYYGRLTRNDAADFAEAVRGGRIDLEHLRGRSSYPFGVQAAEVFLRRRLDDDRARPYTLEEGAPDHAVFAVDGRRWRVDVSRTNTRELLTCKAVAPAAGWTYALVGLSELG